MAKEENKYNEYDEVNLIPLFRFFKSLIDALFDRVAFVFRAMRKRALLVVLVVISGISAAIINYNVAKPVYHSNAIFSSNMFSNDFSEQFIEQLHRLCKEKNFEELAVHLEIPVETARQIKDIGFEGFSTGKKDSLYGEPFKINLYVFDNNLLDSLEVKILAYMENNPYAAKRKEAKIQTLKAMSHKVQKEIVELDSVKKNLKQSVLVMSKGKDRQSPYEMSYVNPVETYKESIDMYMEGLLLKEQVALLKNYEVIQGFVKFSKPYSPRMIYDPVMFALCSLIFAAVLCVYLELKRINQFKSREPHSAREKELQLS